MLRLTLFSSALAYLLLTPVAATAAPVVAAPPNKATVTLVHPLTLLKTADLDFGTLIVNGAGTAVINPVSNVETTTGGVVMAGGTPHGAAFTGAATGLSLIFVQQPTGSVTLTRVGGTQTMSVSNFTMQNGNLYLTLVTGAFSFRVGGTLNVAAGQLDGNYVGTFDVTATYF
jgi:Domain of unknown function (DUF4402)